MFEFFKKKPIEPPTTKQLNYARKLGIKVTSGMTRSDVSNLISAAEEKNPKVGRQRRAKRECVEVGLVDAEDRWNDFADKTCFLLAIFKRGKTTHVDVLQVNEAFVDRRGKLKLTVAAPKRVKDRDIGEILDWDKSFQLPAENLLYYEPLHANFGQEAMHPKGIEAYQKAVKRGLVKANKLKTT